MKTFHLCFPVLLLFLLPAALCGPTPLGPQFRVNPNPTPDLMSPRVAIMPAASSSSSGTASATPAGASSTRAGSGRTAAPRRMTSGSPIRS